MIDKTVQAPADLVLARIVSALDRSLGVILAILMFAMMLLTFFDVLGRQGFNAPISGSNEMTEIAMGFVVYIGLPLVCIRREHISIGLFAGLIRGRGLQIQHVVLNLALAAVTFIWAHQVWIQAEALVKSNEVLMFLQVSVAPYVFAMSVLTYFSSLLFVLLAWCHFRGATPKASEEAG